MKIKVRMKKAYGNIIYYPECEISKMILSLIKRDNSTFAKTFVQWQIDTIKDNGWEIDVID